MIYRIYLAVCRRPSHGAANGILLDQWSAVSLRTCPPRMERKWIGALKLVLLLDKEEEVYGMFSSILIFLCFISYSTCNSNKYIGGFCLSSFCLFLLIDFLCVTDATLGQSRHQRFWCVGAFTAIIFNTSKTKLAKGRTFASQWHPSKRILSSRESLFLVLELDWGKNGRDSCALSTGGRLKSSVTPLLFTRASFYTRLYGRYRTNYITRTKDKRETARERERIKESQSIVTLLRMYIYPYVLHWVIT